MKIGVIFCGFNAQPYLTDALRPWAEARKTQLGGNTFEIAAVSVPFESFPVGREDDTLDVLRGALARNEIDHLIEGETSMKETEARGAALKWLIGKEADVTIQVDADEVYTVTDIERIFAFVESRAHWACFQGCLKNRVFDRQIYLVEPFRPMRIHRVQVGDLRAAWFWDDNNVAYKTSDPGRIVKDIALPGGQIPKTVAWVDHFSWMGDEHSRKKCVYQWQRWGRCSFKWDTEKGLIWNPDLPIPEAAQD